MSRVLTTVLGLVVACLFLSGELYGAVGGGGRGGGGRGGGAGGRGGGGFGRGGGFGPGGGFGRGGGEEYPCEWTKFSEDPTKKLSTKRQFLYVYLYKEKKAAEQKSKKRRPAPRLTGNFYSSEEMQEISTERLVFVETPVSKKPTKELLAILKRYKIRRIPKVPLAVIADRYWNPLYKKASIEDPAVLVKQIKKAKVQAQKIQTTLEICYEKALEYCKQREFLKAVTQLSKAQESGLVGIPILKEMEQLFRKINVYLERQFDALQKQNLPSEIKKERLLALRAHVHKDLPLYVKITAACKEL